MIYLFIRRLKVIFHGLFFYKLLRKKKNVSLDLHVYIYIYINAEIKRRLTTVIKIIQL